VTELLVIFNKEISIATKIKPSGSRSMSSLTVDKEAVSSSLNKHGGIEAAKGKDYCCQLLSSLHSRRAKDPRKFEAVPEDITGETEAVNVEEVIEEAEADNLEEVTEETVTEGKVADATNTSLASTASPDPSSDSPNSSLQMSAIPMNAISEESPNCVADV